MYNAKLDFFFHTCVHIIQLKKNFYCFEKPVIILYGFNDNISNKTYPCPYDFFVGIAPSHLFA